MLRKNKRQWHERCRFDMERLIAQRIRETREAIGRIEKARQTGESPNVTRDPSPVYAATAAQILDLAENAEIELSADEIDELVAVRMRERNFNKEEISEALEESPVAKSKLSDKDRNGYKSEIEKRLNGRPIQLTEDHSHENVEALKALMHGN